MTDPVLNQVRRGVTLGGGTLRWEVLSRVTNRGDLPFKEVFVLSIVDPLDPKRDVLARIAAPQDFRTLEGAHYVKVDETDLTTIEGDTFARIANIADLTGLPRDRVTAVQKGQTEYLSACMVKLYDTVVTATAAAQAVRDRLSELVTAWRVATGDFLTTPSTSYTLPVPDPSIEAARIAAYRTASTARQEAEAVRDAAVVAHAACTAQGEALRAVQGLLLADVAFLQEAKTVVQGLSATVSIIASPPTGSTLTATITDRVKDFALATGASAGDRRSYDAFMTLKVTMLNSYRAQLAAHAASCGALEDALHDAQRAADRARADENAALTRVMAVCPTFTP